MRDYFVIGIILAGIPICLLRPYLGTLYWAWISFMNPHRYAWGVAVNFPVAMVVGGVTLIGYIFSKDKKLPKANIVIILVLILWVYFGINTLFALNPEAAILQFIQVSKILLMAFVTLSLCLEKNRFEILFIVIAFSIGLVGLKGGIFGLLTGGQFRVWGPPGSFLEDNNDFALALNMTLPIMFYLSKNIEIKWLKYSLLALFGFSIISIILTYSRGGFLGLLTVVFFLGLWSKYKVRFLVILAIVGFLAISIIPQKYFDRMSTIEQGINKGEVDDSVQGRFNAWWFAYNLAKSRPFTGGGFQTFTPELFKKFAPNPTDFHDSHSIYFEMLGEQGFIAFFVYILMFLLTIKSLHRIRKYSKYHRTFNWAYDYSLMLEISILAFLINGVSLGRAYFDLLFHLIIGAIALNSIFFNKFSNFQKNEVNILQK